MQGVLSKVSSAEVAECGMWKVARAAAVMYSSEEKSLVSSRACRNKCGRIGHSILYRLWSIAGIVLLMLLTHVATTWILQSFSKRAHLVVSCVRPAAKIFGVVAQGAP